MPPETHRVYLMTDADTKGEVMGGAADAASAISIACAVYAAKMNETSFNWLVGVFDLATDENVGYIGSLGQ